MMVMAMPVYRRAEPEALNLKKGKKGEKGKREKRERINGKECYGRKK